MLPVPERSSQGPTEGGGGLGQAEDEEAPFIITIHGIPPSTTNMYNMMVGRPFENVVLLAVLMPRLFVIKYYA